MKSIQLIYLGKCDNQVMNQRLEREGHFASPTEWSLRDESLWHKPLVMAGGAHVCDDGKFFRANKWITHIGISSGADLTLETIETVDRIVTDHLKGRR